MDGITSQGVWACVGVGSGAMTAAMTANAVGTVGVGYSALAALTSGVGNVAMGFEALKAVNTGGYNTAVGYQACGNASFNASFATAVGYGALKALTDGGDNTALGRLAGDTITTGDENTCLGHASDVSVADAQNQSVIGHGAIAVADDSVTLGNADVTSVYMAQDSGAFVHCGGVINYGKYYAYSAQDDDQSDGYFRWETGSGGARRIWEIRVDSSNNYNLDSYNGSAWATPFSLTQAGALDIAGSLTENSDEKLKDNVQTISGGLSKINQLRGVSYTRNDQQDTDKIHLGVIAQEVEEILPEVVSERKVAGESIKGVSYTKIVSVLIEAVKELSAKVEELEAQVSGSS
jgi:hypothetical protein